MKVGDFITRNLAGIKMRLRIVGLTDEIIDCGWTFDRNTGAEIDEELGWGPPPKMTGSYVDLNSVTEQIEIRAQ